MAGQTSLSEISADKQALNTIFQFLKHQNLKETEETLKKELGIPVTSAPMIPQSSSCSQPEEVEEAYSRAKYQSRSHSTSVPMSNNPILVDSDDDDDSQDENEEEQGGPRSWPGTHRPAEVFLESVIKPDQVPFRTPVLASPPLIYKPSTAFPMPTLFTLVPPGLFGSPTQIMKPLFSPVQPVPSLPVATKASPVAANFPKPISSTTTATAASVHNKPSTPVTVKSPSLFQKSTVTLASIPTEELTPAHLELKEFAEEFKTKRIQLGYTQGAVGQSLADKGYSNFAQSTISRFEQMQLSPSNAATIMTVLKRWLYEAENPELVSSTTSNDGLVPPRKRKKRVVYTPQALTILNSYFQKEPRPNRQTIERVSEELDLLPEEVRVWFCNKRQKQKMNGDFNESFTYQADSLTSPCSPHSDISAASSPPPPSRTKFTIEELSKSSAGTTSSALSFTSNLTVSHQVLRPMVFATRGRPVSVVI